MEFIFRYFPYFFALMFILVLATLYGVSRFIRFEGNLKRGIKLATIPLTPENRQFLESLPRSIQFDNNFIRKEINEVLIVQRPSFSKRGSPWIGYVDLSNFENKVELRGPLIFLVPFTVGLIGFFSFYFFVFSPGGIGFGNCLFPLIVLVFLSGVMAINYAYLRQQWRGVLTQAMESKSIKEI